MTPKQEVLREAEKTLLKGGVVVMPTDTIYGVTGSALNKKTVTRIYELRRRNPRKPMIILIGAIRDLKIFGLEPDSETMRILKRFWPGKASVIIRTKNMKQKKWGREWHYLHRGTNSLAFRLPKPYWLKRLLSKTGPLVAPSANPEGKPPATDIHEAKEYFGAGVDFYVDGGRIVSKPSKLIGIINSKAVILRK